MRKAKTDERLALCYVGDGAALPGVPARDLSADDVQQLTIPASLRVGDPRDARTPEQIRDLLIASGLYAPLEETK